MQKLIITLLFIGFSLTALGSASKGKFRTSVVAIQGKILTVSTPTGDDKRSCIARCDQGRYIVRGLDFNGYTGVKTFRSSGNVQKVYDAYLYNTI